MLKYEECKSVILELGWRPIHDLEDSVIFYSPTEFSEVASIFLTREGVEQNNTYRYLPRSNVLPLDRLVAPESKVAGGQTLELPFRLMSYDLLSPVFDLKNWTL